MWVPLPLAIISSVPVGCEYYARPSVVAGVKLLDAFVRTSTSDEHPHMVMMFGWNISRAFTDHEGSNALDLHCRFPDGLESPLVLVGPDHEHTVAMCAVPGASDLNEGLRAGIFAPHLVKVFLMRKSEGEADSPSKHGEVMVNVFPFLFSQRESGHLGWGNTSHKHASAWSKNFSAPLLAATHMSKNTHTHIHTYTYTHTHIHTYKHTHIETYTHTHIHTYTHTHTHIHTYTLTP